MADVSNAVMGSVTQSIGMFTAFLPSLQDVRKADPNDAELVNDVRMGELVAASIALAVGAISSNMTDSSIPICVAAIAAAILIFVYESILRSKPKEKR